ncbi:MAG: tetratricopeptide repeat protein [Xanthomonadaceae bacterium]|jgi:predicted O-linked N-acetylglucosamine transferase (SPINDLY family)|nr:tetratricopeptide repeat protein [Xanthomonadaceae bacterium]
MSSNELNRLRTTVRRAPHDFIAWVMLADAELNSGDARAGKAAALQALRLRPEHPEALARLGRAYWMRKRYAEAAEALRQASAMAPQHPGIALWLGHALEDAGEAEAAAQAYERAYRLLPQEPYIAAQLLSWRRKLCDWRDLDTLSRQIRHAIANGQSAVEPFAFLNEDASAAEQLACAILRSADIARRISPLPAAPSSPNDTGGRNASLKLGFLSNGFGAHPTGLLTAGFFEALAAEDVAQIHLFALNPDDGSPIRHRLRRAAHVLHDLAGHRHADIAMRIREAAIDVLFDLRGWGGGGVPEVLAMRPAPVQVNWLAYPGTSGAAWIDYVLADDFVLPESMSRHFSESIIRLPRCFQPSDTTRSTAIPPPRSECGLPDDATVFCCFNNSYKYNPRNFSRMMAILRCVPGSILWLLSGPGKADERLRAAAAGNGVDAARLVFMRKLPHMDYLARYRHADLFLDTIPYNAHTTASDALWVDCPVLTQPGATFAARVAGSLNHHLGLSEMNADSDASYVERAIMLGNDRAAREDLRQRLILKKQQTGVFDMRGFVRDFIIAAQRMAYRKTD